MMLRFMKRSLATAALVASVGFLVAPTRAVAGEMEDLLKDGVELLKRGKTEDANAKFRAVLAADPSSDDAYNLVKSTDFRVFLEMLKAGGNSEQVAARLLDLSHQSETAKSQDEAAIKALVTQAVRGKDLGERMRAVHQIVASHGEYAVPALLNYLGSNDIDARANAIIALSRVGMDAVTPLAAGLATGNDMQRRNAAEVLGRIGDHRALPALLAAAGGEGMAAESAAAAAAKLGGDGDAAEAYLHLAMMYFHGDAQTLLNYDGTYTVWSAVDGELTSRDVPQFLYQYEMAEQACYDALALNPALGKARSMIAVTVYAELSAWDALGDEAKASEGLAETKAALDGAAALAASTGTAGLMDALAMAVHMKHGDAASMICSAIADLGVACGCELAGGNALTEALTNADKTIRYGAAIALLRLDPGKSFPMSNLVAKAAGDAASEAAIQQVLVIDSDSKNAMNVQRALNGAGYHVVAAQSGAEGLMIAKATGAFDAIVVRDTLGDITTFQVLDELKRDFRTDRIKTVVMAANADLGAATSDFESRGIAGAAPTSDDSVGVINAVKAALGDGTDRNAAMANGLSVRASNALAGVRGRAFMLKDAQPGLLAALRDGAADDVRLAALGALANIADNDAIDTLAGVVARSDNSADIRAAAAKALGTALRGQEVSDGAFKALLEAMGDDSVAVRTAAGGALGATKLSDEQRAEVMTAHRVN